VGTNIRDYEDEKIHWKKVEKMIPKVLKLPYILKLNDQALVEELDCGRRTGNSRYVPLPPQPADFLIVHPEFGLALLEVKSSVKTDRYSWTFFDRSGGSARKHNQLKTYQTLVDSNVDVYILFYWSTLNDTTIISASKLLDVYNGSDMKSFDIKNIIDIGTSLGNIDNINTESLIKYISGCQKR